MTQDAMTKMSEQYQKFLAPVIKANKLAAANLETLVNFQMSALQSYVDMAINRMKVAADISDPASLHRKLMDDSKVLADLTARFKAEFDKLVQESLAAIK